jgi:exonuclease SbcC
MPSWLRDLGVAPEALRAFLGQLLPEARLTNSPSEGPYEPLLLVEAKHIVAAFGFANGDLRESYDALYTGFKSYYASHQDQWGTVDLAFVFCVDPEAPQLDQFCSGVETDVYFCRKFVVPLEPPLAQALARLPFLPLAPLRGRPLRPASAQTFLQQCGVPAILAKFLVVQHERSPEGIVEDCASGEFGPPGSVAVGSSPGVARTDLSGGVIRLASVEIKNFRAYRKRETFALGSQVTVLYGPNGFGKTSFFDAIDFAVTGVECSPIGLRTVGT